MWLQLGELDSQWQGKLSIIIRLVLELSNTILLLKKLSRIMSFEKASKIILCKLILLTSTKNTIFWETTIKEQCNSFIFSLYLAYFWKDVKKVPVLNLMKYTTTTDCPNYAASHLKGICVSYYDNVPVMSAALCWL